MALIRRCETCGIEATPPKMFSMERDAWWHLYQAEQEQLDFCTIACVQEYFNARQIIQEVTE